MSRRVAFATCEEVPNLSDDDRLAVRELERRGVEVSPAVWSAPADWSKFDAVVIRSAWYYWLHYEKFRSWLDALDAAGARVWNPVAVLRDNIDKRYLRRLAAAGVPVVPTAWLEPGPADSLAALMEERRWNEVIIKPVVSGGAFFTYRLDRAQALAAEGKLKECWRFGPAMVQPFLPSIVSEGEYSLLFIGGRFSHAVLKQAAPEDFRVQHIYGGTTRPVQASAEWIKLAERIQAGIKKPLLYARVDMAVHDGRPCLMELELTEPYLYFENAPESAARFADALLQSLES